MIQLEPHISIVLLTIKVEHHILPYIPLSMGFVDSKSFYLENPSAFIRHKCCRKDYNPLRFCGRISKSLQCQAKLEYMYTLWRSKSLLYHCLIKRKSRRNYFVKYDGTAQRLGKLRCLSEMSVPCFLLTIRRGYVATTLVDAGFPTAAPEPIKVHRTIPKHRRGKVFCGSMLSAGGGP